MHAKAAASLHVLRPVYLMLQNINIYIKEVLLYQFYDFLAQKIRLAALFHPNAVLILLCKFNKGAP
jgi:hypothetical protein